VEQDETAGAAMPYGFRRLHCRHRIRKSRHQFTAKPLPNVTPTLSIGTLINVFRTKKVRCKVRTCRRVHWRSKHANGCGLKLLAAAINSPDAQQDADRQARRSSRCWLQANRAICCGSDQPELNALDEASNSSPIPQCRRSAIGLGQLAFVVACCSIDGQPGCGLSRVAVPGRLLPADPPC
jgi:hypothetical protein